MELFKHFKILDGVYILSLLSLAAIALYTPWITIPIEAGINFINQNAVSIVISLVIFLIALFFVDDKLSAVIAALGSLFALAYIVFQFFAMGGFTMNLPMIDSDNIFDFIYYGTYTFIGASFVNLIISILIFRRDDDDEDTE